MPRARAFRPAVLSALSLALLAGGPPAIPHPDHHEFEASVYAPFQAAQSRSIQLAFQFPDSDPSTLAAWRLDLLDAKGAVLRSWHGQSPMPGAKGSATLIWDGRGAAGQELAKGFYTLRLHAKPMEESAAREVGGGSLPARIDAFLAAGAEAEEVQDNLVHVGPAPRLAIRPFGALPHGGAAARGSKLAAQSAAAGSIPYQIFYGNLHSQTDHSDGGSPVNSCSGAEVPQVGTQGPTDAYEMMRTQAHGDFLLTSEHNHMFDGSTGTNTASDPADPTHNAGLFATGLGLASSYRAAHPEFLALYGMEWGVISNGGHLNIINPDGLATWEYNGSGQLLGNYYTPKSDYPSLYTFMKGKGWIGQFNHPASTGQFLANGTALGYTADGDEVMVLCEVMNTSAFSTNLTSTETSHNFYETAWNKLLEAGYHVAPSSDQDNHCSNWGLSYPNRLAVLIPNGLALNYDNFMDALKARHTFATMDSGAQIVLRSGSAIMGDRISNSGPLTLNVDFATTTAGRSASQITIYQGVPGSNGTVTAAATNVQTLALTPSAGPHFYYAVVIEDNGDKLWSAPIWVDQAASPVSAAITAPASDLTVASGAAVSFTATASTTNSAITATSWNYGDGSPADTGLGATHTFTNTGAANATYAVTFTATDDQSATGAATRLVTVTPAGAANTPPTITAPSSQSLPRNGSAGPLSFTVGDIETPAAALTVTATSSNQTLLPDANLSLGNSGATRSISLAPAADQTGSATVTLTVTDGSGASTTATFTVTVYDPSVQPQLIISQYYEGVSNNKWLEITNVGTGTYDFSVTPLYVGTWFNPATGGTTYSILPISGTLAPGAVWLAKNSASAAPVAANITGTPISVPGSGSSSITNFNGDDVTYITPVNAAGATAYAARVDVVGANDPSWTTAVSGGFGKDKSLVRNFNITRPSATFNVGDWTVDALATVDNAAAGTTDRLGEHQYNHPPTISSVSSLSLFSGQSSSALPFTVGDTETAADQLTVTASSSNVTLIPDANLVLGGSGASRTLTLTPLADQTGDATITLTVTDGGGNSTLTSFDLTVSAAAPPTATASETGARGSVTLSAQASAALGVSRVDFYVDGSLAGSSSSPSTQLRRGPKLKAQDAGAATYTFSLDSTTLADGSHNLVAEAFDTAGNEGDSAPLSFSTDNTAPTVSAGAAGSSGTIALSATAADNVGVARVDFYVDGALAGSSSGPAFSLNLDSTTLADGPHSLVAKAFDAAGNEGDSASVGFSTDNTAPTGLSASVSGQRQTLTLTGTASDSVGLDHVVFLVDGNTVGSQPALHRAKTAAAGRKQAQTAAPNTYSLPFDSTTIADGAHTFSFQAFDAAGNQASAQASFSTDNTVPAGNFDVLQNGASVNNQTVSGVVVLSATASDGGSGVQRATFYVDGAYFTSVYAAPYTANLDTSKLANGPHTLLAYLMDKSGNISYTNPEHTYITSSNADTTAPTGSTTISGTSGTITFSSTASDASGIARVTYYVDGRFYKSVSAAPYSATLDSTKLSNGTHYVLTYGVDNAGNIGYFDHGKAFTVAN